MLLKKKKIELLKKKNRKHDFLFSAQLINLPMEELDK